MKIPSVLVLFPVLVAAAAPIRLIAQPAPAPAVPAEGIAQVDVTDVKFAGVRSPSGETWLEATVEVNAKPGGRMAAGEFVDHVRVTLNLGIDVSGEGTAKRHSFYRASAEAVALEGGSKSVFRFYLPPEVVRRDKITVGDSGKFYFVELEVAGKQLPPGRGNASPTFKKNESIKSESVQNFLGSVSSEGGQNLGVLIPQHLSPFASDSQRRAPSMVRREGER